MNSESMSVISLFLEASLVVQLVMLLLLAASLLSWVFIVERWRIFTQARGANYQFEERFWSGVDLVELFRSSSQRRHELMGMEAIFEAGFAEYARLRKQNSSDVAMIMDGAQRSMRVALNRELDRLEVRLPFLATVGSTSPYIGLFGTVWGIMNAFRALGVADQATLAMVAPGIAEALVATAIGLFAAIPAVIAYNRYSSELERLESRMEIFKEEFAMLLQRQAATRKRDEIK
ncbi:protein TolQ [Ectothiorhodospiraceae bacterium BW-2]|nr:protein TolQ [Ectothiorhodospiraceae bacterium BW-2]